MVVSRGGRLITAQEFDTHVSQLVTRGRLNQSSRWTRIQFGDERVEGRPEYSIWSGDMWGSYLFDPMTVLSAVQVSASARPKLNQKLKKLVLKIKSIRSSKLKI